MDKSFVVACKEFFGFQAGQTLIQFRDEINGLTHADKVEIAAGLSAEMGVTVKVPPQA